MANRTPIRYHQSMQKTMLLILTLFGLLAATAGPAAAQEPGVQITQVYAFDPAQGKQTGVERFDWPASREMLALVRFTTSGYDSRKTVEVFSSLANREGKSFAKWNRSMSLHAGDHEVVLPLRFDISRYFATDRLTLTVEVKLTGGNRQNRTLEVVVNGPNVPRVSFTGLKLLDPDTGQVLERVFPGRRFRLSGEVSISGNNSETMPGLHVFAMLSQDEIKLDLFSNDPFSDVYRDSRDLNARNGKWRFSLLGEMPAKLPKDPGTSQPFEIHCAIVFSEDMVLTERLGGTILPPSGESFISGELDERLIHLERNWLWSVAPVN